MRHLSEALSLRSRVFYDLETTGFGAHARVVQLGALCGRRSFSQLIHPGVPIPAAAAGVHGICDSAVKGAPSFREAWGRFLHFLNGALGARQPMLLLGYNSWAFDDKVLHVEFARAGLSCREAFEGRPVWSADVLRAVRASARTGLAPEQGARSSLRLGDVYERLTGGILHGAHDALQDCRATETIYSLSRFAVQAGPFDEGSWPVAKRAKLELPFSEGVGGVGEACAPTCEGCARVVSRFFACPCTLGGEAQHLEHSY